MTALKAFITITSFMFITGYVTAATKSKAVEFSADAVISLPQTPVKQSKLFVSKEAVRREMSVNGQNMVEIVYPDQGRAVFINSNAKSYEERNFSANNNKDDSNSPCAQINNAVCEKLGKETIDGIKTEKWQIISNDKGRTLRTLHWIDSKRKLAIREFFPDGSVAELKLVKKEKVNGRNTEKWQRSMSRSDGSVNKSFQWYDTELGIAIREELPGGYLRELKNIKVIKQKDKLFAVPEGYVRMNRPPQRMQTDYINR